MKGGSYFMKAEQHVLRIQEMDARIEEALRKDPPVSAEHEVVRYAPPPVRDKLPPLPNYVEHREGMDTVGKAAAQAIVMQYDSAMKALEAMGKELIECVSHAQTMAGRCTEVLKYVAETCDQYRDESKAIFARIEHASALTAEVRKVCDEMREKIKNENSEREHSGHSNSSADEEFADQQAGLSDTMVRGQG